VKPMAGDCTRATVSGRYDSRGRAWLMMGRR
jgi:hypothetical protein